jgi:hypothetical protein
MLEAARAKLGDDPRAKVTEVDCFFKVFELAIFGGRKSG